MVFPTLALREVKFNNQETSSCSQGWLFRGGDGAIDLRRLHIHLLLRHWTLPRSRSLHNILSRSRQLYDLLFVGSIRGFQVFFQLSSVLTRHKAFCLRVSGEGVKSFFLELGGCQSTLYSNEVLFLAAQQSRLQQYQRWTYRASASKEGSVFILPSQICSN